ncbi:MAG: dephospho-CoA kinase [Epsilonproteobacteria bacterium]|nr:dephospho-CoA kinase [Campylobacterota bacterium]
MAFQHAIALTGGIATGKSSACNLLKLYGLRIIDADSIAHRALDEAAAEVARLFGEAYLKRDGGVDRKKLGTLVFADEAARKELEALLHPRIFEAIAKESEKHDALGGPYIVDIPLFYERGNYPIDKVVVVYAPRALQKERLMRREGLDESAAEARLNAQMDIEKKRQMADWVIDNSGNLKQLQRETERIFERITNSG